MVLEMIGKRKYNNLDIIAYNIFDFSHEPKGAILWAVCKREQIIVPAFLK